MSPATIRLYRLAVRRLTEHAGARALTDLDRAAVEAFLTEMADTRAAATAHTYFRSCRTFFNWLVAEDELEVSPMAGMQAPIMPEQLTPVLSDEQVRALFATCERGKTFAERRDHALLRFFVSTGARLAEAADLAVEAVDLDNRTALVLGKGRRERIVTYGARTTAALDRYLRARARHPRATTEAAMWLGDRGRGPLTHNGVWYIVRQRGRQAGIVDLHPHMLRHLFAAAWLANGGTEGSLMRLGGWRTRQMLDRYGAASADARARAEAERLAPDDKW